MDSHRIIITDYATSHPAIRSIREAVFIKEQSVPREIEFDDKDEVSIYAIALNEIGNPIGTGRLTNEGKIGRLAVLKPYRNQGVGAALLSALEVEAVNQGFRKVSLHAQIQALSFYKNREYIENGPTFLEANIEHIHMFKILS